MVKRVTPFGFPDDFAGILAALDALPTRDDVAPEPVDPGPPPAEPRRKGGPALTGIAAARRNQRLTRIRWARITVEQRAEHNRKRRARYALQRIKLLELLKRG